MSGGPFVIYPRHFWLAMAFLWVCGFLVGFGLRGLIS